MPVREIRRQIVGLEVRAPGRHGIARRRRGDRSPDSCRGARSRAAETAPRAAPGKLLLAPTLPRPPPAWACLIPAVIWERDDQRSGPSEGLATPAPTATVSGHLCMARLRLQPPPRRRSGSPRERFRQSFLVVPECGVPRSPVKSSLRQTAAWAGGRRDRSARCGGGSPDSAGGARV